MPSVSRLRWLIIALLIIGLPIGVWRNRGRVVRLLRPIVIAAFHGLYYNMPEMTWENTRWLGTMVEKNPLDLWIFQEIIYETRPDVIVETGTFRGGSALYMANIFDLLGRGQVITIDIEEMGGRPAHARILCARLLDRPGDHQGCQKLCLSAG